VTLDNPSVCRLPVADFPENIRDASNGCVSMLVFIEAAGKQARVFKQIVVREEFVTRHA
jgi:hypothetical protein